MGVQGACADRCFLFYLPDRAPEAVGFVRSNRMHGFARAESLVSTDVNAWARPGRNGLSHPVERPSGWLIKAGIAFRCLPGCIRKGAIVPVCRTLFLFLYLHNLFNDTCENTNRLCKAGTGGGSRRQPECFQFVLPVVLRPGVSFFLLFPAR